MGNKIIIVEHDDEGREDLASIHLKRMGFDLEWRRPFQGEALNASDGSVCGTVILGGAPNVDEMDQSPFLHDEAKWIEQCLGQDIPVLGLCLGAQLIAHVLGARVAPHDEGAQEFGFYEIFPASGTAPFVPHGFRAAQYHSRCFEIPAGATALGSGKIFPNQAFRYGDKVIGTQFHPECTHSMWRRWQAFETAPWDKPGAQSRDEQNRLGEKTLADAGEWFIGLLDNLFPSALKKSA